MIPTHGGTISTVMTWRSSSTTGLLPLPLPLLNQLPRTAQRRRHRTLIARLPNPLRQTRLPRQHTLRPCRPHPIRGCVRSLLPREPSPQRSLVQGVRHPARRAMSISVRTPPFCPQLPRFHLSFLSPHVAFTGKLGLLPKRPISLVRPQSPPATNAGAPRVAATPSKSTTDSSTDREEPEFLENPFEDPR